jgi:hypothetical protein
MNASHCFNFIFIDQPCRVELLGENPQAAVLLQRYQAMFPHFSGPADQAPDCTVQITDLALRQQTLTDDDSVFGRMREYFSQHYGITEGLLLDQTCSPLRVPDAQARDWVSAALDQPERFGLSLQKDFLVRSERGSGRLEALADVSSSLKEAWAFHVLNFFKVFFFANGAVRLHSSSAIKDERLLLWLANTGGGKSTMKEFFLKDCPEVTPFTDDSIIAMPSASGFGLYQDPVEFMRWAYLPEAELTKHQIPEPRKAVATPASLYYMEKAEATHWQDASPNEVLARINQEAFYQKGFLTQRFVPPPGNDQLLERYFSNTLDLLGNCHCHLASIRHNDDYAQLFASWRSDLGIER